MDQPSQQFNPLVDPVDPVDAFAPLEPGVRVASTDDLSPPSVLLPPKAPQQTTARQDEGLQRLWASLAQAPYAHDLFHTLRRIQALQADAPRLGEALRPRDEAVRLGQDAELDFAPANLHSFSQDRAVPRIGQRGFGLFGPMGPMPLHLTEYVRERERSHADPTLARFADLFHHRALLMFFRAWAQSRPEVHRDRPWDDDFARWVSSLYGQGGKAFTQRSAVNDDAKRLHAATLMRGPRNAEGLAKVLRQYFGLPVRVEACVGHWLPLSEQDRTQLRPSTSPHRNTGLGHSAVLGRRVWDRQSHARLHIGPLSFAQFQQFMPGQPTRQALRDWVREVLGLSVSVDAQLALRGSEIPRLQMRPRAASPGAPGAAAAGRLGLDTWLGRRGPHPDSAALRLRLTGPGVS
jgi:type VI secretion system protein ImpH